VASRLVPRASRHHIAAIYAFARVADDFADEGDRPDAERIALLEDWRRRLNQAATGRVEDDGTEGALIFTALAATMKTCSIGVTLFSDLISAFSQDVMVKRYRTWEDLLDYCRRSANPVGRLVLRVTGAQTEAADRHSDAVCTALQLTNFWQDIERDWTKGRVYVPHEIFDAVGANERDLGERRWTPEWTAALEEAGRRTRALFAEGRPVADAVHGRLRYELRATWLGGVRILDKLEAARYDVFARRPTLGRADALAILWHTIAWN
jgi:squalene synthase HpnC